MLTIERSSPISNKLVVATFVFAVGFIGSLSTLKMFYSDSGQLSSGRPSTAVSGSEASVSNESQAKAENTDVDDKQPVAAKKKTSDKVKPVSSVPVDSPSSRYKAPSSSASGQSSKSGTIQLSGQMPVTASNSASTASSPAAVSGPTTTVEDSTAPTSTTTTRDTTTDSTTSLTQPITNTTATLLPSLSTCSCDN